MARKARGERNNATVHEMSPETRARYDAFKSGGVKGWSRSYDPWSWSHGTGKDAWAAGARQNPGIWPPHGAS